MDAAAELRRNPVSKHYIQPEYGAEQADAGRDCQTRLAKPNSQARRNADRETFIFPAQLSTCRIGNLLTRLIHTLLYVMCDHTNTYCRSSLAATTAKNETTKKVRYRKIKLEREFEMKKSGKLDSVRRKRCSYHNIKSNSHSDEECYHQKKTNMKIQEWTTKMVVMAIRTKNATS